MENQNEPTPRLLDIVKEFLKNEIKEYDLGIKTQEKHKYQYQNLERFLISINQIDIKVNQIKIRHMEAFKNWIFNNTLTKSKSHVTRHLRMCIKACDLAVRMEYMEYNSLHSMQLKRDKKKRVISCNVQELSKFEKYVPNKENWLAILHAFLFQCYTGISFIDLWLFELLEDIILLPTGQEIPITWVTCINGRGKTQRLYWAELIPEAKSILDLYPEGFPKISNQTYNRIIKKIAKELGVNKSLTTHIGRKTFATFKRKNGYSVPAIADMLGNTEEVARTNYIELNKELIITEIIRVKQLNKYNLPLAS